MWGTLALIREDDTVLGVRPMGDLLTSWKKPVGETPLRTAVRFPVRLAVDLRAADQNYQAITEDISANGLLFTGARLPSVDSVIEFTINMPSAVMGTESDVESIAWVASSP